MFYTVMKMEQQNTTNAEGVEILKHSTFEDEILGKGQYTLKLYHFLRCSFNNRECKRPFANENFHVLELKNIAVMMV